MADNNAAKGLGLLAMIGLLFAKTCTHDSSAIVHESEEIATHTRPKPNESFSCNKPHVQEDVHIDPPPEDIHIDPSKVDNATSDEPKNISNEEGDILNKDAEGNFAYSDGTAASFKSLNDINFDKSKVLIVDGNLTDDEIKTLNKKGVNFICNKEVYEKQKDINNIQVVFIFSEDRETLKNLYSINDDQVDEVLDYAKPIIDDDNILKVDSKNNLQQTLFQLKQNGTTPIVVFNNRNKTLFDLPISDYDISNVITCNSYTLKSEIFFSSTDFIGIKNVMKSVANTKQQNLFDFYKDFSNNYSTMLYEEKKYRVTIVATSTATAAGGVEIIIYYNQNT